jgi:hypothetical protein
MPCRISYDHPAAGDSRVLIRVERWPIGQTSEPSICYQGRPPPTPTHTRYPLHMSQFRNAFVRMPLNGPGEINYLVRGPAYVYAILTDPRITP